MKILVLGNGAREHSIAWKLRQFSHDIYLHPGNAGTLKLGFLNLAPAHHTAELIAQARSKQIELIIIGPEALLVEDYATHFRQAGFLVLGPGREGAQLESSKVFSKEFMVRAGVPTADFKIYQNFEEFKIGVQNLPFPKVLKLDGLAAGKGVVIAKNASQAFEFAENVWTRHLFGNSAHKIIEEEFIPGVELSYLGLCDGETFIPLSSSTDFKRVFDKDEGPNTGGMGAISPSPYLNSELEKKINQSITKPILQTLKKENLDFRGVLYIGIMIDKNHNPFVLEFNTRFGDPETQSLMMRINNDPLPALLATAQGKLNSAPPIDWKKDTAVYVVAASPGYPENPKIGSVISGTEMKTPQTEIFFAGVSSKDGKLLTSGGRVLGVGALGKDCSEARDRAYQRLKQISWAGIHYRTDIGISST